MQIMPILQPGQFYHIYNRGNNGENLFYEERNYPYFLQIYVHHIYPIADTYTYCLMRNHFHILVRIKSIGEAISDQNPPPGEIAARHFSNLFNAYTKAINKAYGRTGSLYEERFKRIMVTTDAYFMNLIFYIHFNPQKHGFVSDFREWRWSSYGAIAADQPTRLQQEEVIGWFGDVGQYLEFHQGRVDEKTIAVIIEDDFM